MTIPVAIPELGEEEAVAAAEAVRSGWVTQGPRVAAFEQAFAGVTGANHACAVANCTTALHYALAGAGVKPGDVVITVSHSFIATANAVRHCGAEPVFVDIDPDTLNLDPRLLAATLGNDFIPKRRRLWYKDVARLATDESPLSRAKAPRGRLAAILVVHQVGMPADMAAILDIAGAAGVPVVEDAACASGSEIRLGGRWRPIGSPLGQSACFSFHPRKVITTGDGGMITTAEPGLDRTFRLLRQHGMSVSDLARHKADKVVFEDYVVTGYNGRLTDIQAAVGIVQLGRLPAIVRRRRELAAMYAERLAGVPGLSVPVEPDYARTNWQSYVVRLARKSGQKKVLQYLLDHGVIARRGIMCSHLERPYASAWKGMNLRHSEIARDTGIILPLYPAMTEEMLDTVVTTLRQAMACISSRT
jgi:dTDP-4-amino-4,6-dideoxygalactose transaminase